MADIKCPVCGEPWDAYGVRHGDMKPWEAVLFRAGAGCPACEGKHDGDDHVEDHMKSLILDVADDDPHAFALVNDPDAKRPEWKRPEDVIVFQCAGCDSQIVGNVDWEPDSEFYREWSTPSCNRSRYGHRDRTGEFLYRWSTDLDELYEIDGKKYCAGCATTCDDCSKAVFCTNDSATGETLYGDTYDAGASFADPRQWGQTVCTECFKAIPTCAHCGELIGDSEKTDDEGRGECCAPKKADDDTDEASAE